MNWTIQKAIDQDHSNVQLREDHVAILNAFNEASLAEERFLKQKAKVKWLQCGDSNTAYFHSCVKSRVARNRIEAVTDMHGVKHEGDDVHKTFVDFYSNFIGKEGVSTPLVRDNLFTNKISNEKAENMVRGVTDDEIRKAMFSMGDDKSPGPDGFIAAFFKAAWDIIGLHICRAIHDFFRTGKILKEINHTVITLIPKVRSPSSISDFLPISLCNVIYKCISKIIADRLKEGLKEVVSINQSAFVPERRITDNILLTQELMHNYHLDRGVPRCAFKVDIQKAYDTVDWNFLRVALVGFGLKTRMINWIMECDYYIFFSLYQWVTVRIVQRKARVKARRSAVPLSFYVINGDDLFIFMHGDVDSANVVMKGLMEFKEVAGLAPNLHKSTAYFCNVLNYVKLNILNILPFEEGRLPKYLGVPLVSTRLVYRDCKELIGRVEKRIHDWRNKFLSFAGRLQLIKSVLSSMQVCRGKAKVAWEIVCLPKEEGGLGIRRLDLFNVALLSAHIWNIITLKESLWVCWIHMYKLRGQNFWNVKLKGNMSWGWRKLLQIRCLIRKFFWYNIGNGCTTSAWYDNWSSRSPLIDHLTPRMISAAGFSLNDSVAMLIQDGAWKWPSNWNNQLHNVEIPILMDNFDSISWRDRDGNLKVFSIPNVWEDIRTRDIRLAWTDLVWHKFGIPKHAFMLLLVFKRRLKTQDMLRSWDLIHSSQDEDIVWPLCELEPDSHNHLFFECSFSDQVWRGVLDEVNMVHSSSSWDSIIQQFLSSIKSKSFKMIAGRLILAAAVYMIWQERKSRLFKKQKKPAAQLVKEVIEVVRLKLLTFRYKRSARMEEDLAFWKIPISRIL
uniref:uncharacterized protein LOC122610314 n=1 Tax=Erigeron canadensis TaxID=72917 RepID=UPI001CB906EF|nr:uncharacterized protein LOC122610314 [Erigeron canadensis]